MTHYQEIALTWLDLPNPDGVSNREVLKPYVNGNDITQTPSRRWIVDFGQMSLEQARKYRRPIQYVENEVKPTRDTNNRAAYRERWWWFSEPRPGMRRALNGLERFIVTSSVSKHRFFLWFTPPNLPSSTLVVFADSSDFMYGVLNSSIHICWADGKGSTLEDRSRYGPTTCFETFPFPKPSSEQEEAIARAARFLEQMRQFLKRPEGAKLTLTGMYNELEAWRSKGGGSEKYAGLEQLSEAHRTLDAAVTAAYGWTWPLEKEEVLSRLLALNLERATLESGGVPVTSVGVEDVLEEGETL